MKTVCSDIYTSMSQAMYKLSPLVDSPTFTFKEAVLVRCFTALSSAIHKDDSGKSEFVKIFSNLLSWSLNVLDNDTVSVIEKSFLLH